MNKENRTKNLKQREREKKGKGNSKEHEEKMKQGKIFMLQAGYVSEPWGDFAHCSTARVVHDRVCSA